MAKVTVDRVKPTYGRTAFLVSDEEDERVYRIARRAFDLFEGAGWDGGLEVIKCTVWRKHQYSAQDGQSRPFLMTTFQLPITPPHHHGLEEEFLQDNKLLVRVEWEGHHVGRLLVYPGEGPAGRDIVLKDIQIETVAKGLVQAVQQAVEKRQRRFESMGTWLDRGTQGLASVLGEQVAA